MTIALFQNISDIDTSEQTVNKALHHQQIKDKLTLIFSAEAKKGYEEGYSKGYLKGHEDGVIQGQTEVDEKIKVLEDIKEKYNNLLSKPCENFDEAVEESIIMSFGHIIEAIAPTILKEDNSIWKKHLLDALTLIPANSSTKTLLIHPENDVTARELFSHNNQISIKHDTTVPLDSFEVKFDEHTIHYSTTQSVNDLIQSLVNN